VDLYGIIGWLEWLFARRCCWYLVGHGLQCKWKLVTEEWAWVAMVAAAVFVLFVDCCSALLVARCFVLLLASCLLWYSYLSTIELSLFDQ
jgi:hypothetical protein